MIDDNHEDSGVTSLPDTHLGNFWQNADARGSRESWKLTASNRWAKYNQPRRRMRSPKKTKADESTADASLSDISPRRRGINSVEIGLHVLQCVIELRGPASLKSIAKQAGMDPSQTHRYVSSLVHLRLLKQESASGLYDLGPGALQIGLAALARQDAIAISETAAREFSQQHGATTLLSLWGSHGPTIVRWYHGNPPVYTTVSVGSVLPLTRSATGKVFMSFLADPLINPLLAQEGRRVPLSKNPDLVADCHEIRMTYIASVDGSITPGMRAHAVPILGFADTLVAVLAIVLAETTPRTQDKALRSKLLTKGRAVSLELGAKNYAIPQSAQN
jgi:DNA-binding IclR family transcriptional regulator